MSFSKVKALKPPMSVFDLSYEKKFDFDFGQLIPVACEEMVPGDVFKIGNEIVIRFNAMFAPVLQEINAYVHYFFVPTRLIWDDWEEFITGGEEGPSSDLSGPQIPRLISSNDTGVTFTGSQICGPYSLYDYFGFPTIKNGSEDRFPGDDASTTSPAYYYRPMSFPWRCVNLIWNEYYRDENLQTERDLDDPTVPLRNWAKDYFTSALQKQQRGTAPALPISGILPVTYGADTTQYVKGEDVGGSDITDPMYRGALAWLTGEVDDPQIVTDDSDFDARLGKITIPNGTVNIAGAATIDVADLRVIFQVEKWMERNQRSGVRYTEFLHSHWSVSPRDDRLQRPEYLGGSKSPIIVSEVVQTAGDTSEDPTPIGKLYGKGITADKNYVCTYKAKEFGYLVGLLSVMPKPTYQQGVDRQWLRKSRWDFCFPEFSHLSEQEVTTEEVYAFRGNSGSGSIDNGTKFGYQARYNEMRANKSKVCGALRDTLDYWHLGRKFDSVPQLNSDFITCDPTNDDLKRIFQVQNVPGMICNFANIITGIRPIPKYGEPGLVDHY